MDMSAPRLHLREPCEADRETVMAYREEFLRAGSSMDGTSSLNEHEDFDSWLAKLRAYKSAASVPPGIVPADTLLALDENERLVGMVSIRHCLNDYLLSFGGHIGYSVRPSERRRGFAKEMLRLALLRARALGIERVMVSCDKNNPASAKTILANGGVLENEVFDASDGTVTQRYWIENK